MRSLHPVLVGVSACLWLFAAAATNSQEVSNQAEGDQQALRQLSQQLLAAYNSGQAQAIAAAFLPDGEAVDEEGNVYQGREQLEQIFGKFFEAFPGAKMTLNAAPIRWLGPDLAVEEGVRKVVTADGTGQAATKYVMTFVKHEGQWLVASARESPADQAPTPHERLLPLAWLVGDWVDENAESRMLISCRWSEDENFLLMDYIATTQGRPAMKTRQRIGWDPLAKRVRSWTFDSDGGYGDAHWTAIDAGWVVKSAAVLPDGQTGSATLFIQPVDQDRFVLRGFDRIVGDETAGDFEAIIVRQPPAPGK